MRKLLSFLILLSSFIGFIPTETFAEEETYFVVTAYYSPLPNQKYYLKGNYEAEKRLNGQGIRGASGRPVFSGMLAAPGKYTFGTKIHLEWLGIGSIEDRGGAIVPAGQRGYSHDRIDVWVGYGDEWLRRALYWGKRKVKGTIVASGTQTNLDYNVIPAPEWATRWLKKVPSIFHKWIGTKSSSNDIQELQKLLIQTGHYTGEVNGIYNEEMIDTIYDFQQANNIQTTLSGSGYWGAKTRNLFLKQYLNGKFVSQTTAEIIKEKTAEEILEEKLSIFDAPVSDTASIKKLQNVLTEMGIYTGEIDGKYVSIREDILNYQLTEKIIETAYDTGAGYFGPKTRKDLKENYSNYIEDVKRKQELEKRFSELEEIAAEEAEKVISSIGTVQYGDISTNVRNLQVWLKTLGYADFKDTAIFGKKTENSIISFQIDAELITNAGDIWAGRLGPKTTEAFKNYITEYILEEKLHQEEIYEEVSYLIEENESEVTHNIVPTLIIQKV